MNTQDDWSCSRTIAYSLYHASQPCLCIIFSLFLSISSSNAYCTVLYSQFTSLLKRKKEKNNFVSFLHVANSLVIPGARYMPIVLCTGGGRTLFEHCRRSGAASWWECGVADDELLLITRCDRLTRFSSKNPLDLFSITSMGVVLSIGIKNQR